VKMAIPAWNDCVSNVFDFAHRLLVVDIENDRETNRLEIPLDNFSLPKRAGKLHSLGVDVLVCGAISQVLSNMVTAYGIQVFPYVTGRVDDVLQAYFAGQLIHPRFTMPGGRPRVGRGFGLGGRVCRRQSGRGKL